jgi:hypothetical protein
MQKMLWAVGWGVKAFLWIVKGVLLVIALGALVLWPMSRGKELRLERLQYEVREGQIEEYALPIICNNGQILVLTHVKQSWRDPWLADARRDAAAQADGSKWHLRSRRSRRSPMYFPSALGPFHWRFEDMDLWLGRSIIHAVSAPCWFVAPVAAVWPMASIGL